jgi:hypothetical protein
VCGSQLIAINRDVGLLLLSKDKQALIHVHLAAGDSVRLHGFVVHAGDGYETPTNLRAHFDLVGIRFRPVDPTLHGLMFRPVTDIERHAA